MQTQSRPEVIRAEAAQNRCTEPAGI